VLARSLSGRIPEETMNLQTCVRALIAVSFCISGLVETLGASGLVVELSPAHRWGPGVHTLAVSGPLLMVGAALLASGRMTRWVLSILSCYIFLSSVGGDLPLIFNPDIGGSAITELLINLAVMGGILYWLHCDRKLRVPRVRPAHRMAKPAPALPMSLLVCRDSPGQRHLRQVN
jgi:uncharacterized membrane protein YphA (DoxX/SURF4 family)